jgi:hypothetical protein
MAGKANLVKGAHNTCVVLNRIIYKMFVNQKKNFCTIANIFSEQK